MYKINSPRQLSGIVTWHDISEQPATLFTQPGVTNTTIGAGAGLTTAFAFNAGRSTMRLNLGTTDNSGFQSQFPNVFRFVDVGDYARITGAFHVLGSNIANLGLFMGLAVTDTTIYDNAIANLPTDSVGIHKAITGTTLSLVAIDDSTAQSTSVGELVLANTTWYDFVLEVVRTGTNTGRYRLDVGTNTPPGASYRNPISAQWNTTALPDADADLRFSIAFATNTTDNVTVDLANFSFLGAKGNV